MPTIIYPNANIIIYLEADINYTIFHLKDGKRIISSATLKRHASDQRLAGFVRVHKSFLLNPKFIENYEQKGKKASVLLANGETVGVSRRKINMVKEKLVTSAGINLTL